jgi:hypothetical protein
VQVLGRGEREVARIAAAQNGVVHRDQLLAAGIGRGAIAHRLKNGRLHRLHPRVYGVGPGMSVPLADETAAVLYWHGHALLTGPSAGAIWGICERPPAVVMTMVGRDAGARPGIRLHRAHRLDLRDLRIRAGLPVTSPARTLIDLAADAASGELESAVSQAFFRDLTNERELERAMIREPNRKASGACGQSSRPTAPVSPSPRPSG